MESAQGAVDIWGGFGEILGVRYSGKKHKFKKGLHGGREGEKRGGGNCGEKRPNWWGKIKPVGLKQERQNIGEEREGDLGGMYQNKCLSGKGMSI